MSHFLSNLINLPSNLLHLSSDTKISYKLQKFDNVLRKKLKI